MEMNYEAPLELRCLVLTTHATPQGGIITVWKPYRAAIMWKDIISIEEAIFNHNHPPLDKPCSHVITARCVYIVTAEFEKLAADWISYKEWLQTRLPNFNLNAN